MCSAISTPIYIPLPYLIYVPKNGLNFKQLKNSRKSFKPRQDCIDFQLSGIDGAFTMGPCKREFYDKLQYRSALELHDYELTEYW
jgi:hypothetical protein